MGTRKPHRVDVGDEDREPDQFLFPARQAELSGLLDRVDGVGSAVGQRHDIGAGGLRAQDEGREVGGVERMEHAAHNAAAVARTRAGDRRPCRARKRSRRRECTNSYRPAGSPPCPCSPLPNRCPGPLEASRRAGLAGERAGPRGRGHGRSCCAREQGAGLQGRPRNSPSLRSCRRHPRRTICARSPRRRRPCCRARLRGSRSACPAPCRRSPRPPCAPQRQLPAPDSAENVPDWSVDADADGVARALRRRVRRQGRDCECNRRTAW